MIEKLRIQNFQSHEKSTLEFDPGVNVIIGPSDSGKSAILRALKWVVWNRPLGDAFRSSWGGNTKVSLEFNDGAFIERYKGKGDDYYQAKKDDEDLEFKAFGTSVPEEVAQILDLSEINIQNQMDSPFLISNNPGEVARHFNKIARIDQIDIGLKNIRSWIRDINQNIRSAEEQIVDLTQDLEGYKDLDKMIAKLEVLEEMEGQKNGLIRSQKNLKKLIDQIQKTDSKIKEKSKLLPAETKVNKLLKYQQKNDARVQQSKKLQSLIEKIKDTQDELDLGMELLDDENLVNHILDLYNKREGFQGKVDRLKNLISTEAKLQDLLLVQQGKLEDLENLWHENMPEICPLCER